MLAMGGVIDIPASRKLVAALPMFAASLAIALSGDGAVSSSRAPNTTRGQDNVDVAEDVFHSLGVVLDPPGMHEHGIPGFMPNPCALHDAVRRDTRDPLRVFRGVLLDQVTDFFKTEGVGGNESFVNPPIFDQYMEDAMRERGVPSWPDWKEEVGSPGDRGDAGVDDDDFAAVVPGFPDVVGQDGEAFGDIGTGDDQRLGLGDVLPGIGTAVDPESHLVGCTGTDHTETAIVIDVLRLQGQPRKLTVEVGLFIGHRCPSKECEGILAIQILDPADFGGSAGKRILPGCTGKPLVRTNQRLEDPVGVVVLHVALHAFRAELALVDRKFLPWLEANHLVLLDLELDTALDPTKAAVGLHQFVISTSSPPSSGRVGRGGTVMVDVVLYWLG